MIRNFKCVETQKIFTRQFSLKFPSNLQRVMFRRLLQLDSVDQVDELRKPPGNRLHQLKDDRKGQWSISVNMQWRVCFKWDSKTGDAYDVEIVDYH